MQIEGLNKMIKDLKFQQIYFSKEMGNNQAKFVQKDLRKPVLNTSIHPYNGIGRIISRLYDSETKQYIEQSGTAFIVARNLIVTAAHVLKFKKYTALCDDIQFFPQQLLRGKYIAKTGIKAQMIHIKNDYIEFGDQMNKKFDFVFIQLQQNYIITENQVLPLDFNYKYKKQDIFNISGYGESGAFANQQTYEQNVALGEKENFLFYKHTTNSGNSGGPVLLRKEDNRYVVVGIHKGSIIQSNYCLLLKALNSFQVNSSSLKFRSPLIPKEIQQKWPQTYIRSYRQKDKTLSQLKQQIKELNYKLKNITQKLIQKDNTILQLIQSNKNLKQQLIKAQNRIHELELYINRLKQTIDSYFQASVQKLLTQSSIMKKQGLQLLIKWLVRPIHKIQFKFKASENNFKISKYYQSCGYLQNTIIIAKTTKGKIVGGYTPLSFNPFQNKWSQKRQQQLVKTQSKFSFIFSLSEKEKFQFIQKCLQYINPIIRGQTNRIEFFKSFIIGDDQNYWLNQLTATSGHQFNLDSNYYNTQKYPESKQSYLKITGREYPTFSISQWQVYQNNIGISLCGFSSEKNEVYQMLVN